MKKPLVVFVASLLCLWTQSVFAATGVRELALFAATGRGDLDRVEFVLSRGADVNAKDPYGGTALISAVNQKRVDIAELLVKNGADPELADAEGNRPLGLAATKNLQDMVDMLLKYGAGIDSTDSDGMTPLMLAAKEGHSSLVNSLLEKGAKINQVDKKGNTPLMVAAGAGNRHAVNLFLGKGASIPTDKKDTESLVIAAIEGDLDQIKALVEQGADLGAITTDSISGKAMFYAAAMGNYDVVSYFMEKNAQSKESVKNASPGSKKIKDKAIVAAAANGKSEVLKLLLDNSYDPDSQDSSGSSALMKAAESANADALELLIDRGADLNAKNSSGDSALLLAVRKRRPSAVAVLLAKGANVEVRDQKGKTPLYHAVAINDQEIATVLLDKKAKTGSRDNDGWSVLHIAARDGRDKLVQLLCKRGADVNLKASKAAKSPLMMASHTGQAGAAQILIAAGAEVNAVDFEGSNALFLASEAGHSGTVETLLDNGADYTAESKAGVTAMMAAAFQGHLHIIRLFAERGFPMDARSRALGISPMWTAAMSGKNPVVEFLLDKGANINVTTRNGVSALSAAVENGHFETVRLLLEKGVDQELRSVSRLTALDVAKRSGQFQLVWLINTFNSSGSRPGVERKSGYLGVDVQSLTPELAKSFGRQSSDGVLVTHVVHNSSAASADIRQSDIILSVNGRPIKGATQFAAIIEKQQPGMTVNIALLGNSKIRDVSAVIEERPVRDFYEAVLKYNPKAGTEYVSIAPSRPPTDPNYYLFHGKVRSSNASYVLVERSTGNTRLGKYWAFELPPKSGPAPTYNTDVMVIGAIMGINDGHSVSVIPTPYVVVKPVAVSNSSGKLLLTGR